MGNDGNGRRSLLSNLFSERQVYVRSGLHSQYVVLSRSLQIGVTTGFVAIVASLGVATYQAFAQHFEMVAQRQTLADLESAALDADRSGELLVRLRARSEAAEAEVARLTAALDDAETETRAGQTATAEAEADTRIAELSAALDEAQSALRAARSDAATRIQELEVALEGATTESRNLATELQEIRASHEVEGATLSAKVDTALAEAAGLQAQLDRANQELAVLRQGTAQAPATLQAQAGNSQQPRNAPDTVSASEQIRRLKADLAGAQATIDSLTADLAAAKGDPTGAGTSGTSTNVAAEFTVDEIVPLPPPPAPR